MAAVDRFELFFEEVYKPFSAFQESLAILGAIYTVRKISRLCYTVYDVGVVHFASRMFTHKSLVQELGGTWGIVTGSTDGIGKAYAQELASQGFNVILISRSQDKLKKVAKELQSVFGVETIIIVADFGDHGMHLYENISKQIQGKEIGILVNNVGITYTFPNYFLEVSPEKIWKILQVNIGAATMMSHMVLPQMVDRQRGAIVNIAASTALRPTPQLSVYAATKTYMDYFSRALQYEYKDSNVIVQSLLPSYVATRTTRFQASSPSLLIPTANHYVSHALPTLRVRSSRTAGYWPHTLQQLVIGWLPEWLWLWGASILNQGIRKHAQLKQQLQALHSAAAKES